MFIHSFTETETHRVLAVCDEEIIGQSFSDEKVKIEVSESFYGEERIDEEELLEKASRSTVINAVGRRSVEILTEKDFFERENILEIDEVPHAQMVRI